MFQQAGPNECALVAITAATGAPLARVQEIALQVQMLPVINRQGTAPTETVRLLKMLGIPAAITYLQDKGPYSLLETIRGLRALGFWNAILATTDGGVGHAVAINHRLGYVDLMEQHRAGRTARDPDAPDWLRMAEPRWQPYRACRWYIALPALVRADECLPAPQ